MKQLFRRVAAALPGMEPKNEESAQAGIPVTLEPVASVSLLTPTLSGFEI